jgi:hypothetical protein
MRFLWNSRETTTLSRTLVILDFVKVLQEHLDKVRIVDITDGVF